MRNGNIRQGLPAVLPAEHTDSLIEQSGVRIERILSRGHTAPESGWFEQDWDEWVMVEQGAARLLFANERQARQLMPGDWVHIPANFRHRVEWTDPEQTTIWLAVHFPQPD